MRRAAVIAAAAGLACAPEGPAPPACGIVLVGGPTVILQSFQNVSLVIVDVPQGLPPSLPVRPVGHEQSDAIVGYGEPGVVIGYQGLGLPAEEGFGLLVQDDSTGVVHGVLIYGTQPPPEDFPTLGIVSDDQRTVPLYGVRVNWHQISNPRCPLLGQPTR